MVSQERPNSRCNDRQYLVLLQMYCFLHMNIRGCVCELEHSLTLCGKLIRMVQLNSKFTSSLQFFNRYFLCDENAFELIFSIHS